MNPIVSMYFLYTLAIVTSILLVTISMLHIYWGFGGLWPGKDKQELIDLVFGKGTQFPSAFSCFFVATGLILFSALPWIWLYRFSLDLDNQTLILLPYLLYFVSGIFFLRGILGYLPFITKHWKPIFVKNTKRIFNPLCIFLGITFLAMMLGW